MALSVALDRDAGDLAVVLALSRANSANSPGHADHRRAPSTCPSPHILRRQGHPRVGRLAHLVAKRPRRQARPTRTTTTFSSSTYVGPRSRAPSVGPSTSTNGLAAATSLAGVAVARRTSERNNNTTTHASPIISSGWALYLLTRAARLGTTTTTTRNNYEER